MKYRRAVTRTHAEAWKHITLQDLLVAEDRIRTCLLPTPKVVLITKGKREVLKRILGELRLVRRSIYGRSL